MGITALAGLTLAALYIARDAILSAYSSVVLAIGLPGTVGRARSAHDEKLDPTIVASGAPRIAVGASFE